ncbi:MAG: SET domain-containing protein-lysine N-methyltransferase [Parcubacteria group bacterium]|nr:SET domain-containing protein-lysine N-methyltransferase [Parcubacteria group bacterium]
MDYKRIIKRINEKPRRNNYVSPNTEVRPSSIHGIGLFATSELQKGTVVAVWGGHAMTSKELESLPRRISSNYAIEVYPGFWLAEKSTTELDSGDFVNHSCTPNCTILDKLVMIAKKKILGGEELTADFSYKGGGVIKCGCGSRRCKRLF